MDKYNINGLFAVLIGGVFLLIYCCYKYHKCKDKQDINPLLAIMIIAGFSGSAWMIIQSALKIIFITA